MTDKSYVVVQIGYEYDDNYYRRCQSDGGQPVHVFFDKSLADKVWAKKNLDELKSLIRSNELEYYMEDGCSEKEAEAYKEAGFKVRDNDGDWPEFKIEEVPEDITDEQAVKLFNNISLRWYDVVEVDATVNPIYKQFLSK